MAFDLQAHRDALAARPRETEPVQVAAITPPEPEPVVEPPRERVRDPREALPAPPPFSRVSCSPWSCRSSSTCSKRHYAP